MKIGLLKEENFRALVESYSVLFSEDSAELMVEKALRAHARQCGGCISCVFSRFNEPKLEKDKSHNEFQSEMWLHRSCVLGLKQDICGEHLDFPLQKDSEKA